MTGTVSIGSSNLVVTAGSAGLNIGDKFFVLLNNGTDLITALRARRNCYVGGDTFLINYLDNGDGGTVAMIFSNGDDRARACDVDRRRARVGMIGWSQRRRLTSVIKALPD